MVFDAVFIVFWGVLVRFVARNTMCIPIFTIVFPATILRCLSTTTIIMLSINVCIAIDCSAFALPVFSRS